MAIDLLRTEMVDYSYVIFHTHQSYYRYLVEADCVCVFACLLNKFEVVAAEDFPGDETP